MAFLDDVVEVSNYHFVDQNDELVSFSVLPIQWVDSGEWRMGGDEAVNVFLLANTVRDGFQRIHKLVVSWRFDLSYDKPEILVRSIENTWIKLLKPKKHFEDIVRPILVTLQCLHFVTRNPETSEKSLGRHIAKVLCLHEARPFEIDLVANLSLINEAIGRNESLAKSKLLQAFLDQSPKRTREHEDLIVEMDDEVLDGSEEEEEQEDKFKQEKEKEEDESSEDDPNENVCALCDEGGDLLCCEGRCLRSFHATKKAGATFHCESLGFTEAKVDAMNEFVCKNCKYEQHQCFVCGKLGFSGESEIGPEVFICHSSMCGRFYHPQCVSNLINCYNKVSLKEIERDISEGRPFTCPIHWCNFCNEDEEKNNPDLQFAICRRCPKTYHVKCLPRMIAFKNDKKNGVVKRAWRDIFPNRVLMYCVKHEMDPQNKIAYRNHIKFPVVEQKARSSRKRKSSTKWTKRSRKRQARGDTNKIESETHLHTPTEIKDKNNRAKTKWKSPSDKSNQKRSSSVSKSPMCNQTNGFNSTLTFASGPWDSFWHHPNGGWIVD